MYRLASWIVLGLGITRTENAAVEWLGCPFLHSFYQQCRLSNFVEWDSLGLVKSPEYVPMD